tara:strand:+ start:273 stop:1148 length:876 start_codon:yes stop_codon:yes gene_type:complete
MIKNIKVLRFNHILKNLLILAPILGAQGFAVEFDYILFINGFVSFSLLTLICYLVNDYTDKKIDKKNILKKGLSSPITRRDFFSILIVLLTIFLLQSYFTKILINYFLFIYFFNFIIYNFYLKRTKYFDLLILNNFYIIRILFGAELFKIDITLGFLAFFYFLFLGLSISKRVIQVTSNKLKIGNIISPYNLKDQILLKNLVFLSFVITFVILIIFILNINEIINLKENFFLPSFLNPSEVAVLFSFYTIWIIRCFILIKQNSIEIDIFKYFLKDKFSYVLLAIYAVVFIS